MHYLVGCNLTIMSNFSSLITHYFYGVHFNSKDDQKDVIKILQNRDWKELHNPTILMKMIKNIYIVFSKRYFTHLSHYIKYTMTKCRSLIRQVIVLTTLSSFFKISYLAPVYHMMFFKKRIHDQMQNKIHNAHYIINNNIEYHKQIYIGRK